MIATGFWDRLYSSVGFFARFGESKDRFEDEYGTYRNGRLEWVYALLSAQAA